jgi:sugar phosphate isomerase/epimerase
MIASSTPLPINANIALEALATAQRDLLADAKLHGYKLVVEVDGKIVELAAEEIEALQDNPSNSSTILS